MHRLSRKIPDSAYGRRDASNVLGARSHAGTPAGCPVRAFRPVTRGVRLAGFFWIESMVRDDGARTLLFDLDSAIQRLAATNADAQARLQLTNCYHNLLRKWAL